jgi:hypothetical protein
MESDQFPRHSLGQLSYVALEWLRRYQCEYFPKSPANAFPIVPIEK